MATTKNKNLFYQLYSRSNDVTSSGFACSNTVDEQDTSFDISGSEAQITDSNGDVLSSIDLSGIHSDGLTQYNTETIILQPKSTHILHGNEYGETYKAQYFLVDCNLKKKEGYQDYCNIQFDILYNNCKHIHISTYEIRETFGTFTELAQNQLNKLKIPISISIKTFDDTDCLCENMDYICFQSTQQGYDFMVRNVILQPIKQDDNTYNGEAGEFINSPFESNDITIQDILDLLDQLQPIYKDDDEPQEYNINCDIFREYLNISTDINKDYKLSYEEYEILKNYFLTCFNENGDIINDELFEQYKSEYYNIYIKYFDQILIKYNFNDIVNILKHLLDIVLQRKQLSGNYNCLEDLNRLIPVYKYPNGAMRGIVLIPDWGTFDSEAEKRVILVNHIADKIETCIPVNDERLKQYLGLETLPPHKFKLYEKVIASVNINALIPEEKTRYLCDCANMEINNITSDKGINNSFDGLQKAGVDTWDFVDNDLHRNAWVTNANNNPYIKFKDTHDYLSNKIIGLYKYMEYLNNNDLWLRVGDGYMICGIDDDMQTNNKNLLTSLLIYNPNDIPVRIKYMIFS